ncbi:hypothetical protein RISK_000867 [Rhodopirellula islandica]|uniref:Uncharacterized protein n=1 Tax=Rhodopirellula islandica TaxID=595434 RepID=A0A0J1BKJ9_RHOIS|nr:hypothetical protein RISK_000867 [Rhodopirellula islandica]
MPRLYMGALANAKGLTHSKTPVELIERERFCHAKVIGITRHSAEAMTISL